MDHFIDVSVAYVQVQLLGIRCQAVLACKHRQVGQPRGHLTGVERVVQVRRPMLWLVAGLIRAVAGSRKLEGPGWRDLAGGTWLAARRGASRQGAIHR
jgi:hypothetical protein